MYIIFGISIFVGFFLFIGGAVNMVDKTYRKVGAIGFAMMVIPIIIVALINSFK